MGNARCERRSRDGSWEARQLRKGKLIGQQVNAAGMAKRLNNERENTMGGNKECKLNVIMVDELKRGGVVRIGGYDI